MPYPQELPAPVYPNGTAPVGTPVKVFAPYAAPAFTSPVVAVGQVVTSVTLQSTAAMDQVNVPFTFGHAFKRGDLAPDCALAGASAGKADLPLQVNVKATHDDGSVRHAIISGVLPSLPGGASVLMGLKRVAPAVTGSQSIGLPVSLPSAKVLISGVAYKAEPTSAGTWFSGSVASDFICNVPFVDAAGAQHPTLTAQFSARAYSSGAVRVDAVIEHCKAYAATTDITYDVTLSANGATVYSKAGLVHTPCTRWKKSFWYGTAPALHIKHDTAYLIATKQVPNYDQSVVIPESVLAGYATDLASGKFEPMQFGRMNPYMGTTGGRPEIGLMPDTHVAALLTMDPRAKAIMLATGDISGSWPAMRRDDSNGPGKGMALSVINFPYASILGNIGDCNNPATGKNEHLPNLTTVSLGSPDSPHQPAFNYLPYLLTGDFFYLEGMHMWCAFNTYVDNPSYRQFEKALVQNDQVRGQAWSLRTMAECAAITPDDHPLKSQFSAWFGYNIGYFNARYTDGNDNQIGVITSGYALGYTVNGVPGVGFAPWMDDFFTQALGHAIELLDDAEAKRLLYWKAKFQIGRMLDPAVCIQDACIYNIAIRATDTSPFFSTLAECMQHTVPAQEQQYACNTPAKLALHPGCLPGDIDGYPSYYAGYPSNYQPGLAAAVDSGYPGGDSAWAKFMGRPTKPDYGLGAEFAILPRLLAEGAITPAPTPAPAPLPTPDPAPAPATTIKIVPAPTVSGTWAQVGVENGTVTVPADTTVRYGYNGKYVYALVSGTFVATNAYFGSDPVSGVAKVVDAFTPAVVSAPIPAPDPIPAPTPVAGTIRGPANTKLVKLTGLSMTVFAPSTLALVKRFTNLTASSKGALTVKDVALVPGTVYAATVADSAGKVLDVMYPLTAV